MFSELISKNMTFQLQQGGPGSVRFGYGLGMERFEPFRFSVLAVPLQRGFSVFQYSLTERDTSGSSFGSWKTVPAVPVPLSVSGKTVPTVPVSGSGSVPGPPCYKKIFFGELISRKLHITCSFVIQSITWKSCFGIIFLENVISVT